MVDSKGRKPLFWMGSSLEDLRGFPDDVKRVMGFALHFAQAGGRHADAKPLKGFTGAGVLEVVEEHAGDAFRGVYTVRFAGAVYVRAEEHYEQWRKEEG